MHLENLEFLREIALPDSVKWMEANLPGRAYPYIQETEKSIKCALLDEDMDKYKNLWERHSKAWLRVWQLMAIEHFESTDIQQVSMYYFRHLPDGYSIEMDSALLGCTVQVFPRKPKKPPKCRWATAGEMIKVVENPEILTVMKKFDGWFDRTDRTITAEQIERMRARSQMAEEQEQP